MPALRRRAAAAAPPAAAAADAAADPAMMGKKDADEANATAALLAAGLPSAAAARPDVRAAVVVVRGATPGKAAAPAPASPPAPRQARPPPAPRSASPPGSAGRAGSAASGSDDDDAGVMLLEDADDSASVKVAPATLLPPARPLSSSAPSCADAGAIDPSLLIRPGGLSLSTCAPLVFLWRLLLNPLKQAYLYAVTAGGIMPTNHLMLTFRTLTRDFGTPNANADHLAERLRDALMPVRGALHRARSPLVRVGRFLLEFPALGIPGIVNFVDARTQWFDAQVKKAVADGFTQVVVVAAGYDTRAYRLGAPGVRFFEVDLPHASETKRRLVDALIYGQGPAINGAGGEGGAYGGDAAAEAARPAFVAADLSRTALIDALLADPADGFDRAQRTLFITEGLTYYLPPQAVGSLLASVGAAAPAGSRFAFDFMERSCSEGLRWNPGHDTLALAVWNKGEPFRSALDERPEALEALLKAHGFELRSLLGGKDLRDAYLPTLTWLPFAPAISPYFRYLACEKV